MSDTPTPAEVDRIAHLSDPVLRNLQITQCYYELSKAVAARTGSGANWCTFAVWASRQAGQSIRKEDLLRALELELVDISGQLASGDTAIHSYLSSAYRSLDQVRAAVYRALNLSSSIDRTSEAVGRGNKKVFEEIALVFARFLSEFSHDITPDYARLDRFLASLQPGVPPGGQRYLYQAFTHLYRSFFTADARTRSELLLCANIEIGYHEQTRLQPEIAEALDAALASAIEISARLVAASFPYGGLLLNMYRLIDLVRRRESPLNRALDDWRLAAQLRIHRILTRNLMSIRLPPDLLLKLGDDLSAAIPDKLRQIVDPDLTALLAQLDPTPGSLSGTGVLDWADLPDRLHFIIDLFRCFQDSPALLDPPFAPQQVADIKAGRLPSGPL